MHMLRQKNQQMVQDFVNCFETFAAELDWNDAAFINAFKRKLSTQVLEQVLIMHPTNSPETLGQWKRATQKVETHLATMKQVIEESMGASGDTHRGPRK